MNKAIIATLVFFVLCTSSVFAVGHRGGGTSRPDLSAGAVTPTAATVGTAVTLSATITNFGSASTGTSFTNLFQRATDASGTSATDIGTHSASTLAAGGSTSATYSYTFPSAATWYVRLCADKSSSASSGTITESNENNNCGAWTAVTATAPAVPTATLSGSPTSITSGQSATLTWSSTHATSCTGTNFSTSNATTGSVTVTPTTTTTYTVSCSGAGGSTSQSFSVSVSSGGATSTTYSGAQCSGGTLAGTYAASTDTCVSYCTGLSASCCTTRAVVSEDFGTETYTCSAYTNTQSTVTANPTTECTWVAGEPIGCVSTSWTARTMSYGAAVTAGIVSNPASVAAGESVLLTWSSANATSCTGTNFSTGNAVSGSVTVNPSATTLYSVACTGAGGSATASATTTIESFRVSCSIDTALPQTGTPITWTALPEFGSGTYSYVWSGSDGLSGTGSTIEKTYTTGGYKSAQVAITSGNTTITTDCPYTACTGPTCACASEQCTSAYAANQWYTGTTTLVYSERTYQAFDCSTLGLGYWNQTVIYYPGEFDPIGTICASVSSPTGVVAKTAETNIWYSSGSASCTSGTTGCGTTVSGFGRDISADTPTLSSGTLAQGAILSFLAPILNLGTDYVSWVFQNRFQIDLWNDGTYDVTLDDLGTSQSVVEEQISTMCSGGTLVRQGSELEDDGGGGVDYADKQRVVTSCALGAGECCNAEFWADSNPYPTTNYTRYSWKVYDGAWSLVARTTPSADCATGRNCTSAIKATRTGNLYTISPGSQSISFSPTWTAVPGTHAIRACADIPSEAYPESDEGNNCGASYTFSISGPDFTASIPNIASGSLITNQAVAFNTTVTNNGLAHTGTFPVRFQIDLENNGSWNTNLDTFVATIGAGGTLVAVSPAWTAAVGTHAIRACADIPSAVDETNEANNCGGSLVVTIEPPTQCADGLDNNGNSLIDTDDPACSSGEDITEESHESSTLTIVSSRSTIRAGSSVTITWTASEVVDSSCAIVASTGTTWPLTGTGGSVVTGAIQQETIFTLSCTSMQTGQSVSAVVTVRLAPKFEEI